LRATSAEEKGEKDWQREKRRANLSQQRERGQKESKGRRGNATPVCAKLDRETKKIRQKERQRDICFFPSSPAAQTDHHKYLFTRSGDSAFLTDRHKDTWANRHRGTTTSSGSHVLSID